MFINFWYPVSISTELTDKPKRVKALGQHFAVFRNSKGEAQCVSDICTHRGAPLSVGKIKGDNIECPYHGWQFNGEGECEALPSLGVDAKIPARTHIDAYPVQEKYGLVFAFLGDLPEEERPPIMDIPEYGDEKWGTIHLNLQWKTSFERSQEAALDPAHAEFVHSGMAFAGDRNDYFIPELDVVVEEWSASCKAGLNTIGGEDWETEGEMKKVKQGAGMTYLHAGYSGPCTAFNRLNISEDNYFLMHKFETPIDEFNTNIFVMILRNFLQESEYDDEIKKRSLFVAEEDRIICEPVDPIVWPETNIKEVLVPADKILTCFRKHLKTWEDKGWRIDSRVVEDNKGRVAYTIPSPSRRTSKNWVIDNVPLVAAKDLIRSAAE